jgi:hypothetical protein
VRRADPWGLDRGRCCCLLGNRLGGDLFGLGGNVVGAGMPIFGSCPFGLFGLALALGGFKAGSSVAELLDRSDQRFAP